MGLKQICLAVSLPVIAFLSLYWLRQRKKIESNKEQNDDPATTTEVKSLVDEVDQNGSTVATHNKSIKDESINNQSSKQTEISTKDAVQESINKSTISELASESFNKSLDETDNFPIESTSLLQNESSNLIRVQLSKTESTTDEALTNVSTNPNLSTKSSIANLTDNNLSGIHSNELYLNNNDHSYKSKSDQHSSSKDDQSTINVPSSEELNDSIEKASLDNKPNDDSIVELSTTNASESNKESAYESTTDKQQQSTVEEAIEALETTNLHSADSFALNNESLHFTDQFATSLTFDSKDNTTFDTANDSSLNATANSTLGTIDDSATLNGSMKTLRSLPDQSLTKEEEIDEVSKPSENTVEVTAEMSKEEVKEDYLNKSNATDLSSCSNSTATTVEKQCVAEDDANFKKQFANEEPPANSSPPPSLNSTTSNAGNLSTTNDIVLETESEKLLNVTEHEFKNDSRIETVNAIMEEIKSIVSAENEDDSAKKNVANQSCNDGDKLNSSIASDNNLSLNKSEDDSICVVYDGTESASNDNKSSVTAAQPTSSKANLDESSDLEIVYEGGPTSATKPKVNGVLNNHHKSTIAKNHHANYSNQKLNHQISKENDDPSLNIICDYCFEIPKTLCGLLIGAKGAHIHGLMNQSNTKISVLDHPTILNMKLCLIKGRNNDINEALGLIRRRFPIDKFPQITLKASNPNLIAVEPISESSNLILPQGVHVEVLLSDFITPQHLFLQQPTHPTFVRLQKIEQLMISTYQYKTPGIDEPMPGIIVAVQRGERWYRGIIISITQENDCVVRLLDYGGFITVPKTGLRQVQRDFMSIPFQAVECLLANVQPISGHWSPESIEYFKQIAQKQILQAIIVSYEYNFPTPEQRIPLVRLYRTMNGQTVNINEELCLRGFAVWVD